MWLSRTRDSEPKKLDLTKVAIQPFSASIVLNRFDCGATPLNRFLCNKAKGSVKRFEFKVNVATLEGSRNCIGYYALQLGSDTIPDDYKQKQRDYIKHYTSFPAVHLSYLAVHEPWQGQGLGRHLLQDVFERVADISDDVGFYALTLQSYSVDSTAFYKRLGFEEYSEGAGQPKMLYPLVSILKLLDRL